MSGYTEAPTRTFKAGVAIGRFLRVKLSSSKLAIAGIGDASTATVGTTEREAFAANDQVAVRLDNAQGTRKCVAAGAIAADAIVYSAANGKVNDVSTGANRVGIALNAAGADGDIIEVLYD